MMPDRDLIRAALQAGPDCPPLQKLAYQMGLGSDTLERRAAEEHVKSCVHCSTQLAISCKFESGAARPEEEESVRWIAAQMRSTGILNNAGRTRNLTPDGWRRVGKPSLLAAALAVATALIVVVSLKPRQPVAILGEQSEVLRSEPLRAVAPLGDLRAVPDDFRWTAVAGAARYVLTVTEVDRTILFQGKIETTSAPLPALVRNLLASGTTLLWSVTAEDPSGSELAWSGVKRFRLQHSPSN
jgi:hypothetical protein